VKDSAQVSIGLRLVSGYELGKRMVNGTIIGLPRLHRYRSQLDIILITGLDNKSPVVCRCLFCTWIDEHLRWIHHEPVCLAVELVQELKQHHRIAQVVAVGDILGVGKPRPVNRVVPGLLNDVSIWTWYGVHIGCRSRFLLLRRLVFIHNIVRERPFPAWHHAQGIVVVNENYQDEEDGCGEETYSHPPGRENLRQQQAMLAGGVGVC